MNVKSSKIVGSLAIVVALLATSGCGRGAQPVQVGYVRTESRSVELGDDVWVHAEIKMAGGKLDVTGGADKLLEADFTYNVAELKPEVEYTDGTLTVQHPEIERIGSLLDLIGYRLEWDLRLNNDVPMDLSIDLGGGEADLRLADLALNALSVRMGGGLITIDLSGVSSLTKLNVDMGGGGTTVDLAGDWAHDLDAKIKSGSGEITLRLPEDVGVRVKVNLGVGKVDANGLKKDGDDYVNDAYGKSDVTLNIDIGSGAGKINLELDE